ncbi:MAG: toll/interleukin-1 receptor domain-containing protein [Anaerolineae bacterium]|nr:MAG: toll/interleukin-1 receptor domain-containing protein [Anaerolineae bacterium]
MTDGDFKYDVFLSHNSKDKPAVEQLAIKLRGENIQPFLDKWHLIPGDEWQPALEEALNDSRTFAIFISAKGISPWENAEMRSAINKRVRDRARRVIPVLLPNSEDPRDKPNVELPEFLQQGTWVDFRAGLDDPVAFAYLLAGIQGRPPIDVLTERGLSPLPNLGEGPGERAARRPLPIGSRLPHPPNPAFTGRAAELDAIAAALLDSANANLLITQSVTGMGGLGKTQLAAEFCHRYGSRFAGVHWLNCQNPDTVDSEIAECGVAMGLALPDTDLPTAVALTLAALHARGPRLVVLDNLEREADLRLIRQKLLPGGDLRLLLTARNAVWPTDLVAKSLPLATFTPEESRAFLRRALGDKPPDADLDALAGRLGRLPLALHLAARYLHATRTKIPAYLDRLTAALDDPSLDNWQPDGGSPTGHNLSLKASFLVSWEQIQDDTARRVFLLAAWCAPNQPIPLSLLASAADLDEDALREALPALESAGLLAYDPGGDQPSLHPLLAEFGRALDKENEAMTAFADALAIECSKANKTGLPANFTPLRPHLEAFAPLADAAGLENTSALLAHLGSHLKTVAAYAAARPLYERSLAIREAALGPDHPHTATGLNNLAILLQDLGDLPAARPLLERALVIWETALGPDHPDTATGLNNLATLLKATGDLAAARPLYERALAITEAALGPDHPDTAQSLNNLALLLHETGDLLAARPLHERALAIWETALGPDHPDTAQSLNNLASLLQATGDLAAARPLYERSLAIREAALGTDHPDTARGLNNLATLLQATGDLAAARPLFERALAIREAALGPGHPDTASSLNNLATLLYSTGDLLAARPLYERALAILKAKTPNHPNTESARRSLAALIEEMESK